MKLDQFVSKYNGKKVDFDGAYGNQCFDLYRQYCKEVLDVPQSPPTGTKGAVTIKDNYLTEHFTKIENTLDGVPKKGDIIIWDTRYGSYGHVAIVVTADVNYFTAFSQNDPSGVACIVKSYKNYFGVNCWLRPKKEIMVGELMQIEKADFEKLMREAKEKEEKISLAETTIIDMQNDIELLEINKASLEDTLESTELEKAKLAEQLKECLSGASNPMVNIKEETTISGKIGVLNGWTIDSKGVVVANYRIK